MAEVGEESGPFVCLDTAEYVIVGLSARREIVIGGRLQRS